MADGGASSRSTESEPYDFFFVVLVVLRRWPLVLGLPVLAALLSVGIVASLPRAYVGSAKVVPLRRERLIPIRFGGQPNGSSLVTAGDVLPGAYSPVDISVLRTILQSRSLFDRVIKVLPPDKASSVSWGDWPTALNARWENSSYLSVSYSGSDAQVVAEVIHLALREMTRIAHNLGVVSRPELLKGSVQDGEGSNAGTVVMLLEEAAVTPESLKRKMVLTTLCAVLAAGCFSILWAVFQDRLEHLRPEERKLLADIRSGFRRSS